MEIDIVTKEDLRRMKKEMMEEIREILEEKVKKENDRQWLRSGEIRTMLGISPGTLQNLRINGTLPYRKIGGSMYYRREDIERMMERGNDNG
ncbi:helix-turn-helix domain-containing protein [Sphingobacterium hotanense]|uniref:helix-turn-helix domain-containing protein n=1 Tax=Sphingobacterium hotanense TaxID=649196 RepID=UPI0021A3DBE9|nr:helix-turn-helix domain-containing protein [Sphingobacterium hotanense]MCT1525050.1 helix-turn-helix domain-containing protein [Sphingobacterium hotanense]